MLSFISSIFGDSSEDDRSPLLGWTKRATSNSAITSLSKEVDDCHRGLTELTRERRKLPWPELVSCMSRIIEKVLEKEKMETPKLTDNPWPQEITECISEQILLILQTIGNRLIEKDVHRTDFILKETIDELKICLEFVKYINAFYDKLKLYPESDYHTLAKMNILIVKCILKEFTVRSTFEKMPPLRDSNSQLWVKLINVKCSESLLNNSSSSMCQECGKRSFIAADNFAITACVHIFCIQCACKMFNVPERVKRVCPVCNQEVSAWTDNKHFKKFKDLKGIKNKTWMALRNMRQVAS